MGSWLGYAWFMTFGTVLPLPLLLIGYVGEMTIVGAPLARQICRFAIFITTFGQDPPGKEKLAERNSEKKPFAERIRPYSPPGRLEKRGRPVSMWLRVVWFVSVGWWLGALWVCLAWSVLLLPYPFLGLIRALLADLPSVTTLAMPTTRSAEA